MQTSYINDNLERQAHDLGYQNYQCMIYDHTIGQFRRSREERQKRKADKAKQKSGKFIQFNPNNNGSQKLPDALPDNAIDTIKGHTLDTIMKTKPVPIDWVWDGILARGTFNMLTSKPKAGKSYLLRQIAYEMISNGGKVIDRKVNPGKVVIFTHEDLIDKDIRPHFEKMNISNCKLDQLTIVDYPVLANPIMETWNFIRKHKFDLVIIDTLLRHAPVKDNNDYGCVTEYTGQWAKVAKDENCCILGTHHEKKSNEGDRTDAVMGSQAWFASLSSLIQMRRKDDVSIIETRQRRGESLERTAIKLEHDKFIVQGKAIDEILKMNMTIVMDLLTAFPGSVTQKEISEKTGIHPRMMVAALKELQKIGDIEICGGRGVKNDPFLYRKK